MILVTGATGMVGRAVVACLVSQGYKVRAHARSTMALANLFPNTVEKVPVISRIDIPDTDLERAVADIATMSEHEAKELCEGCTAVVHTAGLVHQPNAADSLYDATNLRATRLLADAATACGVEQFIFLSSSSVYGNRATSMIDESAELHNDTPYAASKIDCENYLSSSPPAPSTVILRPSLIYGEGDRGNMLSLIRQIDNGKYFIVGAGTAQKSLIYAGDLAAAISLLIKNPGKNVELFNIANPQPVTVKQLSETILSLCGRDRNLLSLPGWFVSMAASAANACLGKRSPLGPERLAKLTRDNSVSVDAFISAYDFAPAHDLEQGLAREVEWFKRKLRESSAPETLHI